MLYRTIDVSRYRATYERSLISSKEDEVAKCQRPPQAVMPRQYTSNTWPVDHVTELGRAQLLLTTSQTLCTAQRRKI
jgi:hypothetical protein